MKYRKLSSAGIKVSAVSLGGWTMFGESIQDQDVTRPIITVLARLAKELDIPLAVAEATHGSPWDALTQIKSEF